jgi:transglutaminase-like putative cysteine protease
VQRYQITHLTTYEYSAPVAVSRHACHLTPRESPSQRLERHGLAIAPAPAEQFSRTDYFGNRQVHFQIEEPHTEMSVAATSSVTVTGPQANPHGGPTCREVRELLRSDFARETLDACMMASPTALTPADDAVAAFAAEFITDDLPYLDCALALSGAIFHGFEFDPGATDLSTPVSTTLRDRRGVCQDFAHLMLACLRAYGMPARYASGYILTQPPPGKPRLQGADASHAWAGVYVPGTGWVDLDPTNNLVCGEGHVTVATGRDFADVSPLRGAVVGGGHQEIAIEVTVAPEGEG